MTRDHETSPPAAPANRGITGEPARPPGARHPDDPRSHPATAPQHPPEARPNRETNRPRHRDTPGTRNLKTDGPGVGSASRDHSGARQGDQRPPGLCVMGRDMGAGPVGTDAPLAPAVAGA